MMGDSLNAPLAPPRSEAGGPEEQAAEWLAYLYSGEDTEQGRSDFSSWLRRSEENAAAYAALQQTWKDMSVSGAEGAFKKTPSLAADYEELPPHDDAAFVTSPKVGLGRRLFMGMGAIAATLALVASFWFVQGYDPVRTAQFATKIGEIKELTLADGSVVTLAAGSSMRTRFSRDSREVELTSGGAYFDVAHDEARPFTVTAEAAQIRVLGTAFDVRQEQQGVRVSVARGVVAVGSEGAEQRRLVKGEMLSAFHNGVLSEVSTFEVGQIAPWRSGRLVYRDARLGDVIAEVNRYRTNKIKLNDDELNDLRLTMAMRTKDTDHLISGLEAAAPVRVERHPGRIEIFAADEKAE